MATNIFETKCRDGVSTDIVINKVAEAITTYTPHTVVVEDSNNDDGTHKFVRRYDGIYVDTKTGRITLSEYLDYLCFEHMIDKVHPQYLSTFAVWTKDDSNIILEFVWRTRR